MGLPLGPTAQTTVRARALEQTIPLSLCYSGLVKVTRHSALFTVSDVLKVKKVKKGAGYKYSPEIDSLSDTAT